MKKQIVLIGDSIRTGYQDHVRALLGDQAELGWPIENGMHSVNLLLHAHVWIQHRKPDWAFLPTSPHVFRREVEASKSICVANSSPVNQPGATLLGAFLCRTNRKVRRYRTGNILRIDEYPKDEGRHRLVRSGLPLFESVRRTEKAPTENCCVDEMNDKTRHASPPGYGSACGWQSIQLSVYCLARSGV